MSSLVDVKSLSLRQVEHGFLVTSARDPVTAVQTCSFLDPALLSDPAVRAYWEYLLGNARITMSPDQIKAVSDEALIRSGVTGELMAWSDQNLALIDIGTYVREAERRKKFFDLASANNDLASAIVADDELRTHEVINRLKSIDDGTARELDCDPEYTAEMTERVISGGIRTIPTGIPQLDSAIGGTERQTQIIVAARPSMGKTALVFQIARNGLAQGKRVMFFSMEMSEVSLMMRAILYDTGIESKDVISGNISPAQRKMLTERSKDFWDKHKDRFWLSERRYNTLGIRKQVTLFRPDLIFIDHLRLVTDEDSNEVKRQGMIADRLKQIAVDFDVPVIAAAQLSRKVEDRQDKRPQLSDLRDSGEIEEYADVVLMLYSHDYYFPPAIPKPVQTTEVWVRKFREGTRSAMVELDFDLKNQWFFSVGGRP